HLVLPLLLSSSSSPFFLHDPATTEIYTLSLHDALPIYPRLDRRRARHGSGLGHGRRARRASARDDRPQIARKRGNQKAVNSESIDRKSTRLNSSHVKISYAVFCLKKKKKRQNN